MANSIGIMKIYPDSFRANIYGLQPFRMIGLIDVGIIYNESIESAIDMWEFQQLLEYISKNNITNRQCEEIR